MDKEKVEDQLIPDSAQQEELFSKNPNLSRSHIFRDPSFELAFAKFRHTHDGWTQAAFLTTPLFRIDTNRFSSRVINHWEKLGLVSSGREGDSGWRIYSLIDLIWLNIIYELREFGFALNKIDKTKTCLERLRASNVPNNPSKFPALEFYVIQAFFFKKPIRLLVFNNGEVHPVTFEEAQTTKELFGLPSHFSIDLNKIIQSALPEEKLAPIYDPVFTADPHEVEILKQVRISRAHTVTVVKEDEKFIRVESEERIPVKETELHKIIDEYSFQDISFNTHNKKIVIVNRTKKERFSLKDKNNPKKDK